MIKLNIVKLCCFHNLKYFAKICISCKTIEYYQIVFIEKNSILEILSVAVIRKAGTNGTSFDQAFFSPSCESRTKQLIPGSSSSCTPLLIKQQSQKREGEWLNKFSIFFEKEDQQVFGRTSTSLEK